jgi:hypothetical protein
LVSPFLQSITAFFTSFSSSFQILFTQPVHTNAYQ